MRKSLSLRNGCELNYSLSPESNDNDVLNRNGTIGSFVFVHYQTKPTLSNTRHIYCHVCVSECSSVRTVLLLFSLSLCQMPLPFQ